MVSCCFLKVKSCTSRQSWYITEKAFALFSLHPDIKHRLQKSHILGKCIHYILEVKKESHLLIEKQSVIKNEQYTDSGVPALTHNWFSRHTSKWRIWRNVPSSGIRVPSQQINVVWWLKKRQIPLRRGFFVAAKTIVKTATENVKASVWIQVLKITQLITVWY